MAYLDDQGLLYLWNKIKSLFVAKETGKGLSANDFTTAYKEKLEGIATGANKYTHPTHTAKSNGLYKVTVDSSGHVSETAAVTKADITGLGIAGDEVFDTDTNGLVPTPGIGGNGSTLLGDNGKWRTFSKVETQNSTNQTTGLRQTSRVVYMSDANGENEVQAFSINLTETKAGADGIGLMRGTDKTKLDGIEEGANKYAHPIHTAKTSGLYKVTVDGEGHVTAATAVTKSDITGLGIPGTNTTYEEATSTAAGLMSTSMFSKLNALPTADTLASTYALKSELAGLFEWKGTVASESKLPTSGQATGDVYSITAASTYGPAGANVVWTGAAWDSLGGIFSITSITNTEIDTICS